MTAFPGVTVIKHGTAEEVVNWLTDGMEGAIDQSIYEPEQYVYVLDVRARSDVGADGKARGFVRLDYPTAFDIAETQTITERDVAGTPMTVYSIAVILDPAI